MLDDSVASYCLLSQLHDWGEGYENVWMMTTAENQEMADLRIPELLKVPARVRGLSMEPLLGPVELSKWLGLEISAQRWPFGPPQRMFKSDLDWIIAGGESGAKARPTHPDWIRRLRDQCVAAHVPFLFKQWGEWFPVTRDMHFRARHQDDPEWFIWPDEGVESTVSKRMSKKMAGRLLDGSTWDQYPKIQAAKGAI